MDYGRLENRRVMILFPHMVIPGGALIYTLRLAEQLRDRGAKVAILTLCHEQKHIVTPDRVQILAHPDGPLTSTLFFWFLWPFWQCWLNNEIRHWEPDIIISQVFPSNWWGWFAKRAMSQIPMLWVCHEPSAFIHSKRWIQALRPVWKSKMAWILRPFLAYVDRRLSSYGDAVVANSQFTADQVSSVYGLQVAGIAHPGVDLDEFALSQSRDQGLLLTVAHLSGFKRIDFLLKVFAGIHVKNSNFRFSIVGDGEKMSDLKQLAERLEIAEYVDFYGRLSRKEIVEMYARASLYLHGGVEEPFGMVLIEALASGCPVLAHASGGPLEIVTPGTGRLMNTLNPEIWSEAALDLLKQVDCQASELCRKRAADFSWNQMGKTVALVSDKLISSANRESVKL